MKNLVTSARLQPVLYLQKQRNPQSQNWLRIIKQNILDTISTVKANYTEAFAKNTLKPRISKILPSLNIEHISDKFPSLQENEIKTNFLFYLYIALYMRFPVLYFFFGEKKQSQTIKPSDEIVLKKIKEKKPLIIQNQEKFKLKKFYPTDSFYINLVEAINRMKRHCFNFSQRAVHLQDLVKIFGLPNLFLSEFSKEKKNKQYYEAFKETKIIIDLLSIHLTVILYTYFLSYEVNITESRLLEKPLSVHAFFTRKLIKVFGLPEDKKLELFSRRLKMEVLCELGFLEKTISTTFVGVVDILPFFKEQFPKDGNPLILVTSYFKLSKDKQKLPPNSSDLTGGTKNFQTKDEALEIYLKFFNEIRTRYPLIGEKGLIQQIISLKHDVSLTTQLQIQKEEDRLFKEILTEFFDNKNFYECFTKEEFFLLLNSD